MATITELIHRHNQGDRAAWDSLFPLLYEDLRRIARQRLRYERPGHTLSTTALVHESYLRLVQNQEIHAEDRSGFLAAACQTMRRLLVDYARTRTRQKRGGEHIQVPLEEVEDWLTESEAAEVLSMDLALEKLRGLDKRAADVVEMRFFGGLSVPEAAEVLGVSEKTVQRTWLAARAWLRKEIGPEVGANVANID